MLNIINKSLETRSHTDTGWQADDSTMRVGYYKVIRTKL